MVKRCERCSESVATSGVLCAECQQAASEPTIQPADMFYDKCPLCGELSDDARVIVCAVCNGARYLPAGIRKAQVDRMVRELTEIDEALRTAGYSHGSLVSRIKAMKTQLKALNQAAIKYLEANEMPDVLDYLDAYTELNGLVVRDTPTTVFNAMLKEVFKDDSEDDDGQ